MPPKASSHEDVAWAIEEALSLEWDDYLEDIFLPGHYTRLYHVGKVIGENLEYEHVDVGEYSVWLLTAQGSRPVLEAASQHLERQILLPIEARRSMGLDPGLAYDEVRDVILEANARMVNSMLDPDGVVTNIQVQGFVAGLDDSTGRIFVHFLQPVVSLLLTRHLERVDAETVKQLLGFDANLEEAEDLDEGVRVRIQGDLIVEAYTLNERPDYITLVNVVNLAPHALLTLLRLNEVVDHHVRRAIEDTLLRIPGLDQRDVESDSISRRLSAGIQLGIVRGLSRALEDALEYLEHECYSSPREMFSGIMHNMLTFKLHHYAQWGEFASPTRTLERIRRDLAMLDDIINQTSQDLEGIDLLEQVTSLFLSFLSLMLAESRTARRMESVENMLFAATLPRVNVSVSRSRYLRNGDLVRVYVGEPPGIEEPTDYGDSTWTGPPLDRALLGSYCYGCPNALADLYVDSLYTLCRDLLGSQELCDDILFAEKRVAVNLQGRMIIVDYAQPYRLAAIMLASTIADSTNINERCMTIAGRPAGGEFIVRNPVEVSIGNHTVTITSPASPEREKVEEASIHIARLQDWTIEALRRQRLYTAARRIAEGGILESVPEILALSVSGVGFYADARLRTRSGENENIVIAASHREHGSISLRLESPTFLVFSLLPSLAYRVEDDRLVLEGVERREQGG